jgi:hypothetical protein
MDAARQPERVIPARRSRTGHKKVNLSQSGDTGQFRLCGIASDEHL